MKLRIENSYTSIYHLEHNCILVEWHRMLHDSMRIVIQDHEAIWDELIPKIIMAEIIFYHLKHYFNPYQNM